MKLIKSKGMNMGHSEEFSDSLQQILVEGLFADYAETFAKEVIEQQELKGALLLKKQTAISHKKKEFLENLKKETDQFSKHISKGIELGKIHFSSHFSEQEVEEFDKELALAVGILIQKSLFKEMEEGASLQKLLKLSKKTLFAFYTVGYELYKMGKYEEALSIFCLLTFLNARVFDYWIARGLSHKMCLQWTEALIAFGTAAALFPHVPDSRRHAIEIYLSLGQKHEAALELADLKEIIDQSPDLKEKWAPIIQDFQLKIDVKS